MYKIEIEKEVVTVEVTEKSVTLEEYVGHQVKTIREAKDFSILNMMVQIMLKWEYLHSTVNFQLQELTQFQIKT